MANGFHGSQEQWNKLESQLVRIDEILKQFGERHRIHCSKSERNWPSRSFRWVDSLNRLIQIYLEDETKLLFSMWICAYSDRHNGRYWKREFLKKSVSIDEIESELPELLEQGWSQVNSYSSNDLVRGEI